LCPFFSCDNFLYGFKGTPYGRAGRPASAGVGASARITGEGSEGDEREARRRGQGWGHPASLGGSLARCLSAAAHRRGPLPQRGQPRTRPLAVPAVTHPRWPRLQS